jgi:oxygen-independent coproporphyrinogen-3 oxidase
MPEAGLDPALVAKYNSRVPRYTSYPTAPHFHPGISADSYRQWLSEISPDASLSLYAHIPYCDTLCWFCGCHTKITRRYTPVARFLEALTAEIRTVSELLDGNGIVRHIHFGGGTPTILEAQDIIALSKSLAAGFRIDADAEFAVEIDPRALTRDRVEALAASGVNRASLGVQDINPEVQRAINREQPLSETAQAVTWLRESGIDAINVDLMYGLPHQTTARVLETVDAILDLRPNRVSLFGYAHVPWMKRHQRLIDEAALPAAQERLDQLAKATERLAEWGYVAIGLDHFARRDDPLTVALEEGQMRRNFQGYTTDESSALVALGPSGIGSLPSGYVQNDPNIKSYIETVERGRLATVRGIEISSEDRLRRAIIERLMCDLSVDLDAIGRAHGVAGDRLWVELDRLSPMVADGLVAIDGSVVTVLPHARHLVRSVCAAFDEYLDPGEERHARAV